MSPPAPEELDELTLARAQRGDEDACRALVVRYQRALFALLARMLGPRGAVEDLAQETFLRAFRALPGFDRRGPARLSTWLLTIGSRLAIDELRRRGAPDEPLDDCALLADDRALAQVGRGSLQRALVKAVGLLPPQQRAAFLLREAHGLSYEEIAVALGIEVGTVRSRLSRARQLLRELLEDEHG